MKLLVKDLKDNALMPTDEVLFIAIASHVQFYPGQLLTVSSGVVLTVPNGYDLMLTSWYPDLAVTEPQSYPSGFEGEIKMTMLNMGKGSRQLKTGDKLCRYRLIKSTNAEPIKEETIND